MAKNILYNNNVKYLSTKEAGKLFGCSNDYISRLCRQGKIPSKKVGKKWFIETEALLDFLAIRGNERTKYYEEFSQNRRQEYFLNKQQLEKRIHTETIPEEEVKSEPVLTKAEFSFQPGGPLFGRRIAVLTLSILLIFGIYFTKDTSFSHTTRDYIKGKTTETLVTLQKLP
ncbi:helix-turn-helix domain-containing protein, partial [Patescibacteria group bacterium]|nr:helix-turn-helix domain-containing protein [Patescibacteria group bacterium]